MIASATMATTSAMKISVSNSDTRHIVDASSRLAETGAMSAGRHFPQMISEVRHANAAAITSLVDRLSEPQLRALLVDLLLGDTAAPAPVQPNRARIIRTASSGPPAVRSSKAKRVIDEASRKRWAAARKAKRKAAKVAKPALAPAAAPSAPAVKVAPTTKAAAGVKAAPSTTPKPDGRAGSNWCGLANSKPAGNGTDEAWKQTARAAVSAAKSQPTAS